MTDYTFDVIDETPISLNIIEESINIDETVEEISLNLVEEETTELNIIDETPINFYIEGGSNQVLWGGVHGDIENQTDLIEELDKKVDIADVYVALDVVFTGNQTYEKGYVAEDVELSWYVSPESDRTLSAPVPEDDRELGYGGSGTYLHEGANLTEDTTYTFTAQKFNSTTSDSIEIIFQDKFYWGTNSETSLNNSQILDLNGFLTDTREHTLYFDGEGKYLYIIYPTYFGAKDIYVNGCINTEWIHWTTNVTNVFGHIENYSVFRSTNKQYGENIVIEIK